MATMATITKLADENITNSREAIKTYRETCIAEFEKIQNTLNGLLGDGSGFFGDAATGYRNFFDQITPGLTTQLTAESDSITSMLESLLTAAEQMLNPVDPQLKQANENAGQ